MNEFNSIPMIKVSQWLETWGQAEWTPDLPEPPHHFFIASIPISTLRKLAGVSRREISERKKGSKGAGYQRAHQAVRSKSIAQYLRYGYPLSSQPSLGAEQYRNLIHPGWLPTSILVNVIGPNESRRRAGKELTVHDKFAVRIVNENNNYYLTIPSQVEEKEFSLPGSTLEPIEIIDGQHRLFALDEMGDDGFFCGLNDYEVPVVFFDGLSESWQAYLFWVINVEPKKINPSLAFDLYPELRNQTWLESGEGIKVYQEHRAQELTEVLWRHEASPWRDRIELHGNRIEGHVSNAAFIRSLMSSFVRRWGHEQKIGGLFGSIDRDGNERVLRWKRPQQAAFLIACWQHINQAICDNQEVEWISSCAFEFNKKSDEERQKINPHQFHPAFASGESLLGTDQGARAVLVVFNAICQVAYSDIQLESWESDSVSDVPEDADVSDALQEFSEMTLANEFLRKVATELVINSDWRTSSSKSLSPHDQQLQAAFRGSSGYSLLQKRCMEDLRSSHHADVADAACTASTLIGL